VITWDGVVTKCNKRHRREMGMDGNIHAYIQSIILKKTFESISIDFLRFGSTHKINRDRELDKAVKRIYGESQVLAVEGEEHLENKPKIE
jgi:hypothetical protein